MANRIHTPEWLDLGPTYYTEEEYNDCLMQLNRIGRFLGGDRATLWALKSLQKPPTSILDVGCGGGQMAILAAKSYPQAYVKGIDLYEPAIAFSKKMLKEQNPEMQTIEFCVPPTTKLSEPPKSFDVVMTNLVCHHFSDDDIVDFIKRSVSIAKEAVIINDLHRHSFATCSFSVIAPLFFPNRLIQHDGPLSIKRAFKRADWMEYLQAAGIPQHAWSLTWHWAFRWVLIIYPGKI
jgi:2-polyprenyl-3-methyl-5-hydroxy-6-metoxy-1,4-benzoquinol methylase